MSQKGDLYREIPVTIWDRKDLRDLSVNAKAIVLYFFMLTGPHTTRIPGLFRAGKAALAEGLRWPLEMFEAAFAELETHEMALADWGAPLVWMPGELNDFNRPDNQNMATGWINTFRLLPECAVKSQALAAVETFIAPFDTTPSRKKKDAPSTPLRTPFEPPSNPVAVAGAGAADEHQQHGRERPTIDDFETFWKLYDKPARKAHAYRAWIALNPNPDLVRTILAALAAQREHEILELARPDAGNWLAGRRWEDEL